MPKTGAERQAEYRKRKRAAGMVEVLVEVHETRVDELKEAAIRLREPKQEGTTE